MTSGPNWKYSSLDSSELIFERKIWSRDVRPVGCRKAARRVKSTSVGIWRRELVISNMFWGEVKGRVLKRKPTAAMKRMRSARDTLGGIGRMGIPCIAGA